MVERKSFWVLQEVFVDPESGEKFLDCELNLSVAGEAERISGGYRVTVEISGSLTFTDRQVANVRFVNLSFVEAGKEVRKDTVLRRVKRKKVEELLSLLPIYLVKAGITVGEVIYEL
ncbi:MAG: hypothetical protein ABGX12_06255 [Desulfurobacteriaceae bacterium]